MDSDFVNIDDYFERGKDFVILKKYLEAIEDLTKAIENFPDDEFHCEKNFIAYFSRGMAYKKLKKYTEAMQDFEKALEFNSSYVETLENLGICLQKLFGSDDAEWAFNFANAIKNGYNFKKFFLVMILWKN